MTTSSEVDIFLNNNCRKCKYFHGNDGEILKCSYPNMADPHVSLWAIHQGNDANKWRCAAGDYHPNGGGRATEKQSDNFSIGASKPKTLSQNMFNL